MIGLAGGCGGQPSLGELDPMLEENPDGKYDGPVVGLEDEGQYRLQIDSVEVSCCEEPASLGDQGLYVTVDNARTAFCPTALLCSYADSPLGGTLRYGEVAERTFSGAELMNGVDVSVHKVEGTSLLDEIRDSIDEVRGTYHDLTHIRIGRTGSLTIKPFSRVKKITFRVYF
jgi:hypothetical protein